MLSDNSSRVTCVVQDDHASSLKKSHVDELWDNFRDLDPEHIIWGINPDDRPPDVVIKRVVFGEKKPKEDEKKSGKKKRGNENKNESPLDDAKEQNKSCIVM